MKIIVLGSGTSLPHPTRSSSGFWLETASRSILLDCSPSAIHRMAEEGCDWANLDAIWISHFHLDHCGGLAPYLFGIKHAPDTSGRTKPLKIVGPPGLAEYLHAIDNAGKYELLDQRFPVEIIELPQFEPIQLMPELTLVSLKTPHTRESHAIRIDDGGSTVVFTADTGPTDTLATFAAGVDLFIIECSFIRNKPVEKHLELAEAMYIIRKAKPKRAMLTHLYPEWDNIDLDTEVRQYSPPCEITKAADGLRLEI